MAQIQVFYIIGVGVATIVLAQLANWLMKRSFKRIDKEAKKLSMLKLEPYAERATRFAVVRRLIVAAIGVVGLGFIVLSLPGAQNIAYSLLAGAGVAAIIVGLAVQKSFANVFAGVMIAFSQPFRIGDNVNFRGDFCTVEDIGLAYTTMRIWTNERIVIPNSVLSEEVIHNYSLHDTKMFGVLYMNVAYDTNLKKAREILLEEVRKHPNFLDARTSKEKGAGAPDAEVLMTDLKDSSVELRAQFWAANQGNLWRMQQDVREAVFERFKKAGITVPYPQRDVHVKR